jgi:hypothetical protein
MVLSPYEPFYGAQPKRLRLKHRRKAKSVPNAGASLHGAVVMSILVDIVARRSEIRTPARLWIAHPGWRRGKEGTAVVPQSPVKVGLK